VVYIRRIYMVSGQRYLLVLVVTIFSRKSCQEQRVVHLHCCVASFVQQTRGKCVDCRCCEEWCLVPSQKPRSGCRLPTRHAWGLGKSGGVEGRFQKRLHGERGTKRKIWISGNKGYKKEELDQWGSTEEMPENVHFCILMAATHSHFIRDPHYVSTKV